MQPTRWGAKDPRQHKYDSVGLRIVNLLFAAAAGDMVAIRRHYLSGIDVDVQDYDGRTALHLASTEGHEDLVRFLITSCRSKVDVKDRQAFLFLCQFRRFVRDGGVWTIGNILFVRIGGVIPRLTTPNRLGERAWLPS